MKKVQFLTVIIALIALTQSAFAYEPVFTVDNVDDNTLFYNGYDDVSFGVAEGSGAGGKNVNENQVLQQLYSHSKPLIGTNSQVVFSCYYGSYTVPEDGWYEVSYTGSMLCERLAFGHEAGIPIFSNEWSVNVDLVSEHQENLERIESMSKEYNFWARTRDITVETAVLAANALSIGATGGVPAALQGIKHVANAAYTGSAQLRSIVETIDDLQFSNTETITRTTTKYLEAGQTYQWMWGVQTQLTTDTLLEAAVYAGAYTQLSLDSVTVTPLFAPTHTVTPSSGSNGSIYPDTPFTVEYGEDVTCYATYDTGYEVDKWFVNDEVAFTGDDNIALDITEDTTVHVTFKPVSSNVTLTVNASGNGQVKVDGVVRTLPWQGTYAPGTVVNLQGIQSSGWTFGYWSGVISSTSNPINVQLDKGGTITANFLDTSNMAEVSYSLEPSADARVSSCSPNTNYDSSNILVGCNGGCNYESFIQFDLPPIENGTSIKSAWLKLANNGGAGVFQMLVMCNSGTWSENGITWNLKPGYLTTPNSSINVSGDNSGTIYLLPVQLHLNEWINNQLTNNGFRLRPNGCTGDNYAYFRSREYYVDPPPTLSFTVYETVSSPTSISGPTTGSQGNSLSFTASGASSNLNDSLDYRFDWGDGDRSSWGSRSRSKTYTAAGQYQIRAQARCEDHTDAVSNWSPVLKTVTVSASSRSISGYIRDPGSNGITNVTVFANNGGGSTTTNSSGYYSLNFPYNWSGRIMPMKSDFEFSPPYKEYSSVTSNQINQNYTGMRYAVQVIITPLWASYDGAMWRVDGGTWRPSDYIEKNLSAGTHTVDFLSTAGWDAPDSRTVSITGAQTESIIAHYYHVADISKNDKINLIDFSMLAGKWLMADCDDLNNWCSGADIDHSGSVDIDDVQIVAEHWLQGTSTALSAKVAIINPDYYRTLKCGVVRGTDDASYLSVSCGSHADDGNGLQDYPGLWSGVGEQADFIGSMLESKGCQVDYYEASSMPAISLSDYGIVIVQDPLRTTAMVSDKASVDAGSLPDLLEYTTDSSFLTKIDDYAQSGGNLVLIGDAVRLLENGANRLNYGKTISAVSPGNTVDLASPWIPGQWLFTRGNPFCGVDRDGSGQYTVISGELMASGATISNVSLNNRSDLSYSHVWSETVYKPSDATSLLGLNFTGQGEYVLDGSVCSPTVYQDTVNETINGFIGYTEHGGRKIYYLGSDCFFDFNFKDWHGTWHTGQSMEIDNKVSLGGKNALISLMNYIYDQSGSSLTIEPFEIVEEGIDGFETGDFSAQSWTFGGNANWTVANDTANEDSYSAQSGSIVDSQTSELILTLDTTGFDTISFALKVSSESGYDGLIFYIDGASQSGWSGELDWQTVTFPVTGGQHTFEWKYTKDNIYSSGSDCAWIDSLKLQGIE